MMIGFPMSTSNFVCEVINRDLRECDVELLFSFMPDLLWPVKVTTYL